MTQLPETRHSLIARLKDPTDQAAWEEFVQIYRPVVYRIGIQKGLQAADAEDTSQKVMLSISKAVERWEPDPQRAKFRTWLNRVATSAVLNAIMRRKPDQGTGDSNQLELLDQKPVVDGPDSEMIQLEHRRECFRVAAKQIQSEFQSDTWQAFWLTSVEGRTVESVAQQLGKKTGSIYTARCRVMKRLQDRVAEMTNI